jgi:hypothetical protein
VKDATGRHPKRSGEKDEKGEKGEKDGLVVTWE